MVISIFKKKHIRRLILGNLDGNKNDCEGERTRGGCETPEQTLERLAGRRWLLKRSLQIEMIDLQEKWGKLMNHGVERERERGRRLLRSDFW